MQTKLTLTEAQRWTILNALKCYEQSSRGHAQVMATKAGEYMPPSLEKQCIKQANEAESMYSLIENADTIEVSQ